VYNHEIPPGAELVFAFASSFAFIVFVLVVGVCGLLIFVARVLALLVSDY
jgi:hypothetical protein